jgi:hypothetical protein
MTEPTTTSGTRGKSADAGETATHRLWARDGRHFAIDKAAEMASPDDIDLDAPPEGVLVARSEVELRQRLDSASAWANSRGHFDEREHQRASGSYLRANSALGENEQEDTSNDSVIIRIGNEHFAIERQKIESSLGVGVSWAEVKRGAKRIVKRALRGKIGPRQGLDYRVVSASGRVPGLTILDVVSEGSVAELVRTIKNYNIVRYDWIYYGVPHGLPIDWRDPERASLPGVLTSHSLTEITKRIYAITGYETRKADTTEVRRGLGAAEVTNLTPTLVGALNGYNIVSYEGWFYGIPQALGPLDLTEVDIISYPGIVRDVSRDVVEGEIADRVRNSGAA